MESTTDTSHTDNISLLDAEIKRRQAEEGVVDIKLFRAGNFTSQQSLARGMLDLMKAPVVKDPDLF